MCACGPVVAKCVNESGPAKGSGDRVHLDSSSLLCDIQPLRTCSCAQRVLLWADTTEQKSQCGTSVRQPQTTTGWDPVPGKCHLTNQITWLVSPLSLTHLATTGPHTHVCMWAVVAKCVNLVRAC